MEMILFLPCSSFDGKTDSIFHFWFYADLALSTDDARWATIFCTVFQVTPSSLDS